jgi:alcohol dehydrogenase class IV
MVKSFEFSSLPAIHFGAGSAGKAVMLAGEYGSRLLLVTGKASFSQSRWGRDIIEQLDASAIRYDIVSLSGEPETAFIDHTVNAFRKNPPDMVMAIGGGSVIDAGKALAAMIPVDGTVWDYLEGNPQQKQHPGTRLPFITLPTTAGTGSEATKNAVLTVTGKTGLKKSLRHDNFIPDVAIVDPLLSAGCPPDVTASSGLDAITQLLEAWVSTNSSAMTDVLACGALEFALKSIRPAVKNGKDLEARSDMAYAAMISGIVLANAGLGAVHGLAPVLGARFNIPHGIVCGTLLGAVTRTNIGRLIREGGGPVLEKYSRAGRWLSGNVGKDAAYYSHCLADELDRLTEEFNIPRLGKYGVARSDAAGIASETGIKNNPVRLSREELENILISRL